MKPIGIIALIALSSVCIGMFQQSRFIGLKRESAGLSREISSSSSEKAERRSRSLRMELQPIARFSTGESLADLEARVVAVCEGTARAMEGLPMTAADRAADKESRARLLESIAGLDPAEALKLIQRLRSESNHPQALPAKPAQIVVDMLMDVNPKILLTIIPTLKDFPNADHLIGDAFGSWLQINPGAAVKWYDEQLEKGKLMKGLDSAICPVIVDDAWLDPSRALSRVLVYEVSGNPERLRNIGSYIAVTLDEADQNRVFFSTLCREIEKYPESAALADIRRNYVKTLGGLLDQWPFESALPLIDDNFTPAEKTIMAKSLSFRDNLDEPEKWATWMSKISPVSEGDQPVEGFFGAWLDSDPTAARKWLEQVPHGELKDKLMKDSGLSKSQ